MLAPFGDTGDHALGYSGVEFSGRELVEEKQRLGTLNDQVTASRLIREIHAKSHPKGKPAPLTRGWIAGRTQLLLAALTSELRKFVTLKKPWA